MKGITNKIVAKLEKSVLSNASIEEVVGKYSLVGDSPFFEVEQFPWAKELEANWLTIRKELDAVMERVTDLPNYQDISGRQETLTNDNLWKTYFFSAFGFKATKNCERCPETTKLLEKIPGLKVAFFSILAPRKHLPEHRGKHKGLIRYHLGLLVPEPKLNCKIKIDNEIVYWEEGKSLIFDDTFLHEVWNDTDGYRAVLFLDIARPLKFPLSLVNWLVSQLITKSDIVRQAKINHEQWEKKFEATASK